MAEPEYQRLTRARRRATMGFAAYAGFASLWLGKDHMLCIESTGYTEEYKRFYYRDIQAIIIRRTNYRLIWSLIVAVPLLVFVFCAMGSSSSGEIGLAVFLGIIAGMLGIILFLNLIYGPTVRCYLKSAVQTEELPSLNRLRRVRKAMVRLRPLIAAAQGQLAPGEITSQTQSEVASTAGSPIINP